ncbi:hypothetical protein [Campylobacter armoricus]|uniref:Uncharacterized protein n=2 Tax=Campylobacter armoricus TaxID=2505970 RepID=A0A7L5HMU0_9BACT|nr:hypothetical protein [Campylobacter armoricus]QKF79552.1 hypothetical protein CARM_0634 [Campylobacter armoricus]
MAGEFLMVYEWVNPNMVKELAKKDDEVIKIVLAKWILELFSGFKNISKKQFRREMVELLKEKGVSDEDIVKLTKLSKTTIWRIDNEKRRKNH